MKARVMILLVFSSLGGWGAKIKMLEIIGI